VAKKKAKTSRRTFIGGPLHSKKILVDTIQTLFSRDDGEQTHYYMLDVLHVPDEENNEKETLCFYYEGYRDNPEDPSMIINNMVAKSSRRRVIIRKRAQGRGVVPTTPHAKEVALRYRKVIDRIHRQLIERQQAVKHLDRRVLQLQASVTVMGHAKDDAYENIDNVRRDMESAIHTARLAVLELEHARMDADTEYLANIPDAEDFKSYIDSGAEYGVWRAKYYDDVDLLPQSEVQDKQQSNYICSRMHLTRLMNPSDKKKQRKLGIKASTYDDSKHDGCEFNIDDCDGSGGEVEALDGDDDPSY
jgi:hypothetical protein